MNVLLLNAACQTFFSKGTLEIMFREPFRERGNPWEENPPLVVVRMSLLQTPQNIIGALPVEIVPEIVQALRQ